MSSGGRGFCDAKANQNDLGGRDLGSAQVRVWAGRSPARGAPPPPPKQPECFKNRKLVPAPYVTGRAGGATKSASKKTSSFFDFGEFPTMNQGRIGHAVCTLLLTHGCLCLETDEQIVAFDQMCVCVWCVCVCVTWAPPKSVGVWGLGGATWAPPKSVGVWGLGGAEPRPVWGLGGAEPRPARPARPARRSSG